MPKPIIVQPGQIFGRLTVVEKDENPTGRNYYECICTCGKTKLVRATHLTTGAVKSCGCGQMAAAWSANGEGIFNAMYYRYGIQAKNRGYRFDITKEEFRVLIAKNCHYCGGEPSNIFKAVKRTLVYNGIDRIDNQLGYAIDNCVPCCKVCNRAKREMTHPEFVDWIKRLVKHQEAA